MNGSITGTSKRLETLSILVNAMRSVVLVLHATYNLRTPRSIRASHAASRVPTAIPCECDAAGRADGTFLLTLRLASRICGHSATRNGVGGREGGRDCAADRSTVLGVLRLLKW